MLLWPCQREKATVYCIESDKTTRNSNPDIPPRTSLADSGNFYQSGFLVRNFITLHTCTEINKGTDNTPRINL